MLAIDPRELRLRLGERGLRLVERGAGLLGARLQRLDAGLGQRLALDGGEARALGRDLLLHPRRRARAGARESR